MDGGRENLHTVSSSRQAKAETDTTSLGRLSHSAGESCGEFLLNSSQSSSLSSAEYRKIDWNIMGIIHLEITKLMKKSHDQLSLLWIVRLYRCTQRMRKQKYYAKLALDCGLSYYFWPHHPRIDISVFIMMTWQELQDSPVSPTVRTTQTKSIDI